MIRDVNENNYILSGRYLLRFRGVVEQEVLLVDFSTGGVDGDNRKADLFGPGVHHLGNVGETALVLGLQT